MSAIANDRPAAPQAGTPSRYTWQAIALHWLLAVLIIGMLWLGFSLEDIPRNTPARGFYVNLHKSFGVLVLLLALLRLAWRVRHKAPPLPAGMPSWQVRASAWSHGLLYLFTLLQALSGYLGSAFGKYGVKFFGLPLPQWAWESKPVQTVFNNIHGVVAVVLLVLVALHVVAALKHLLIDRDQVFQRMWPGRRAR
jgi:cytochrome b561